MHSPASHEPRLRSAVQDAINASGMTVATLAGKAGMHAHALHRHLDGEGRFSVSALVAIGRALGVAPSTLMERAET